MLSKVQKSAIYFLAGIEHINSYCFPNKIFKQITFKTEYKGSNFFSSMNTFPIFFQNKTTLTQFYHLILICHIDIDCP